MDSLNHLNVADPILFIIEEDDHISKQKVKLEEKYTNSTFVIADQVQLIEVNSKVNVVTSLAPEKLTAELLSNILKVLKPEGQLIVQTISNTKNVEFNLKTNGFMNVSITEANVVGSKPKFEAGSSVKLNLKKPASKPAVWKLEDDNDEELIDPDDLLDEDDLKKPDPSSLKVCGTTGKRKACKDCSCGLAEELAVEAQSGKVVDTKDAPKSSCGNCYLGDAFRCASCPYLGMPAFKPGEKIQLTTALMKDDL